MDMNVHSLLAAATVLFAASSAAVAESRWNASLAGTADDEDSRSIDADIAFAPSQSLQLAVGAGSTTSPSTAGEVNGNSLRGAVDVRHGRVGMRGYYRQWTSSMLDADTLGARVSVAAGDLTFSFAGEARGFDVDYETGGSDPQRETEHFKGNGLGGGLKYSHSGWAVYGDAMFYEYDSLSRYVETESPGFTPLPGSGLPGLQQAVLGVAPGLSTSTVTIGESALDRLVSVGIERAFTRVSLRLEWTGAKDAIQSRTTRIYRAGAGYVVNEHVNLNVVGGVSDSSAGSAAFGGLSVGFSL
jgi:hypothetical protein